MKKMILSGVIALSLVSCASDLTSNEIEAALNGNAFNTTVEGIGITHTMNFKEATYDVVDTEKKDLIWDVHTINENIYLNLDGDIVEIYEMNMDTIKGRLMIPKFLEIKFVKK